MPRSGDDEFSTELPLLCSEVEQSLLEARNGIFLAEYVSLLAEDWASGRQLRLTPVVVRECNRWRIPAKVCSTRALCATTSRSSSPTRRGNV